jgi:hypothetical protein
MRTTPSSVVESPVVLQRLEDRLLLSSGPVTIGAGADADAKALLYHDSDGTEVTVQLKGGRATVHWAEPDVEWSLARKGLAVVGGASGTAEIDVIELAGTGLKSALTVQAKKPRGTDASFPDADGRAAIGGILGVGVGVGKITAPAVDLLGFDDGGGAVGIDLAGGARQCALGDVTGAVQLAFGGDPADKLTFTAGDVADASLTFAGMLSRLSVTSWAGGGTITVDRAGSLVARAGNLDADVTATGGGIAWVSVTGGDLGGSLAAPNGMIGNVSVVAKAIYEDGPGSLAFVWGGNLMGHISAGEVKGKSIGNITVVGGEMAGLIQAAGDIGNIVGKWITYKEYEFGFDGRLRARKAYQRTRVGAEVSSEAGKVGNITVTGGDLEGSIFAPAGIGKVTVVGGDLNAELLAENGAIAGVKVAGMALQETTMPGEPPELVFWGGNCGGFLYAGQAKGKSIGNITVTGGELNGSIQAAGDIGNIVSSWLTGKQFMSDGEGHRSWTLVFHPAGMNAQVTSETGKVGNISVTGGDLTSQVVAPAGIGKVSVTRGDMWATLTADSGSIAGVSVAAQAKFTASSPDPDSVLVGGNLGGEITAGQAGGKAVGNITVTGGMVTSLAVHAGGDVGNITNKGLWYRVLEEDWNGRPVIRKRYAPCGMDVQVTSDFGSVGKISATGGHVQGSVLAGAKAAGISAAAVHRVSVEDGIECWGGWISADVEAASIGPISGVGGDVGVMLTSPDVGPVTARVLTVNAKVRRWREWGETFVEVMSGEWFGGQVNATIQAVGEKVAVGPITAIGGDAGVSGEVQLPLEKVHVASKPVRYIASYEENEGGRLVAVWETLGGHPVMNDLTNPPPQAP